jgi:transposase
MLSGCLPKVKYILADKAYDATHWRDYLTAHKIKPVIPSSRSRKRAYYYDQDRYKGRNTIERMFGRLKDYRRIATRYDKLASNFMAALCIAALLCYWI